MDTQTRIINNKRVEATVKIFLERSSLLLLTKRALVSRRNIERDQFRQKATNPFMSPPVTLPPLPTERHSNRGTPVPGSMEL